MNEKIDINYIAKKANVSRSTVSRVLTKKTNVKESTREKVEQVMAELNYHPNSMARGLATGKQNIIALVVSDILSTHSLSGRLVLLFAKRGIL